MEEKQYVTCDECELNRTQICAKLQRSIAEGDHSMSMKLLEEVALLRKDVNSNFFKMFLALFVLVCTFLVGLLSGAV